MHANCSYSACNTAQVYSYSCVGSENCSKLIAQFKAMIHSTCSLNHRSTRRVTIDLQVMSFSPPKR